MTDLRRAVVALAMLGALTACGDDGPTDDPTTEPSGDTASLLQESDLPDVESSEPFDRNGTSMTGCGDLSGLESNLAATEPETVGTSFALAGGDRVISSLLGVYVAEGTVDYTIDRVDGAVDDCVADSSATSFERLEDLPGDAVGFRSVVDTSNGPVTTERAYAVADDQHVVVVTVEHPGEGAPATTVAELLPVALDRAG